MNFLLDSPVSHPIRRLFVTCLETIYPIGLYQSLSDFSELSTISLVKNCSFWKMQSKFLKLSFFFFMKSSKFQVSAHGILRTFLWQINIDLNILNGFQNEATAFFHCTFGLTLYNEVLFFIYTIKAISILCLPLLGSNFPGTTSGYFYQSFVLRKALSALLLGTLPNLFWRLLPNFWLTIVLVPDKIKTPKFQPSKH